MAEKVYETGQKGAMRRVAIVEVARHVLIEEGYDNFVLREIANRADMKLGNLQYYFASREDLLEAVITQEIAHDLAAARKLTARATTAEDALRISCKELVKIWSGEGGKIWGALIFLSMHNARFQESRTRVYANFYGELAAIIERLKPSLSKEKRDLTTHLIASLVDGAALQLHIGASSIPPRQARRLLDAVAEKAVQIARQT
jgi:AcrR family transcriptional regulator